MVEGVGEELLVALELQSLRQHAIGIRQHAVPGHDDVTFDAQCRHGFLAADYSEIVCTTLETGRELTVGSLASLMTSSSYLAMVCTGDLAFIATTLYPPAFSFFSRSGSASAVCLWKSCIRTMPLPSLSSFFIVTSMTAWALRALKSNESRSQENIAMLRSPRYVTISGGCCRAGKRKNGDGETPPSAHFTALKPFSISSLRWSSVNFLLVSVACDQVWLPTVWPAA